MKLYCLGIPVSFLCFRSELNPLLLDCWLIQQLRALADLAKDSSWNLCIYMAAHSILQFQFPRIWCLLLASIGTRHANWCIDLHTGEIPLHTKYWRDGLVMIMKNIFALAEALSLVPAPIYGSQPCVAPALGDPTLTSDLWLRAHMRCTDISTLIKESFKN